MKNPFTKNHLTINELIQWGKNPLINPRTGKSIKKNGGTYLIIEKVYNKCKVIQNNQIIQNDQVIQNNKVASENLQKFSIVSIKDQLLNSVDDRDPISMNIFWNEHNGIRMLIYSEENYDQLIFYTDSKNLLRCLEIDTLRYLKTYNLFVHPVTTEPIPSHLFENLEIIDLKQITESNTIDNIALDVFQYFSKISIFIEYEWFTSVNKNNLLKLNYELADFWHQNFTDDQKHEISSKSILSKSNNMFEDESIDTIQRYLLEEIKILLQCEKEEYKYMINYIIIGALGIVIPKIKELYPDFVFSF